MKYLDTSTLTAAWLGTWLTFIGACLTLIIFVSCSKTNTPASPEPQIVCWQDRLVFIHNFHGFSLDPRDEQRRYNINEDDSSRYGLIQVEYLTDAKTLVRGPRFFAYDALQFWDRTYSKYHRCYERIPE